MFGPASGKFAARGRAEKMTAASFNADHSFSMSHAETVRTMRRLKIIARLMDNAVAIPFTNFRVGLDPLIGLLPVGGDLAGLAVSLYIVQQAYKLGAPRDVLVRMLANVAIDSGLGMVPVAGDAFDAIFKANIMNYNLLADFIRQKGVVGNF
ncbi:MAG: DUF4112 domain-containing protein [Aestuariivirga sp.]